MDTRRKFQLVLIGIILGLAIIACLSGSPIATPISAHQPTLAPPSQSTCGGWRLRLIGVESQESQGWVTLTGHTAVENVNAKISSTIQSNAQYNDLHSIFDNLAMTTAEGYSYRIYNWNFLDAYHHIPPGFRYKAGIMYIQVATGTTHHILKTPCGTLDFDNPETNLRFPTDMDSSSFYVIGAPIQMPEGTLTITAIDGDNIHYSFTNASKGYDAQIYFDAFLVGDDGVANTPPTLSDYFTVNAGPGQTFDGVSHLPSTTQTGRKLIIVNGNSAWVVNIN